MKKLLIAGLALSALSSGVAHATMGILMRSELVSYDGLWKCTYQVGMTPITTLVHTNVGCPYSMEF